MSYHAIPKSEVRQAVRAVCELSGMSEGALLHTRTVGVARWRWAMMAVFRRAGYSYPQIGLAFERDHTSVIGGVAKIEETDSAGVDALAALVHVRVLSAGDAGASPMLAAILASQVQLVATEVVAPSLPAPAPLAAPPDGHRTFDVAIAKIDRALSEVMLQAKAPQDAADAATLRHHAGDLILSGVAILRRLGRLSDLADYLPKEEK